MNVLCESGTAFEVLGDLFIEHGCHHLPVRGFAVGICPGSYAHDDSCVCVLFFWGAMSGMLYIFIDSTKDIVVTMGRQGILRLAILR